MAWHCPCGLTNGGVDHANMNFGESVVVGFDFDQNGSLDLLAGVNGFNTTYAVTLFNGIPSLPYAFGIAQPTYDGGHFWNPATAGDYELSLANFSQLDTEVNGELCFNVTTFAGSINDDGVGEDSDSFEICISTRTGSTEDVPVDFALGSYPNPFNPTATIAFTLPTAEVTELSVYTLAEPLAPSPMGCCPRAPTRWLRCFAWLPTCTSPPSAVATRCRAVAAGR